MGHLSKVLGVLYSLILTYIMVKYRIISYMEKGSIIRGRSIVGTMGSFKGIV